MRLNLVRLADHFPSPYEISYGLHPTFYHLSKEQVKLGLNVHVICRGGPNQKKFEKIEGIYVHRVRTPYNLLMLKKLFDLDNRIGIDLIHAHATLGFPYAITKKFLFGRWAKKVFIAHVHGTTKGIFSAQREHTSGALSSEKVRGWITIYSSILREKVTWENADAIIANSQSLKKELINLYDIPRKNVHVVYNGVDLRTFFPRESRESILKALGLDLKSYIILYLGGFRLVKGPVQIVEAMQKIHERFQDIRLLFVGGSHPLDKRHVKALPKAFRFLREKGVIHLIGNISHSRLPEYYSAADTVVVPSIYDTFPKVVLESMACGTPVIVSNVGGIQELVTDEETGILVSPNNEDELASAIIRIVSDPSLRKKISSKAKKLVEEQFSWENIAKQTLIVYNNLLKL